MKKVMIAAVVAAQPLATWPAYAAEIGLAERPRASAFAGIRLRIPLDGAGRDRQLRAGLTVAPTLHGRDSRGGLRMQFGEGVEYGLRSGRGSSFSIAGQDLTRARPRAAQGEEEDGGGTSTWVWLAVGVVAAGIGAGLFYKVLDDASE